MMEFQTQILSAVLKDGTFDYKALDYAVDLLKNNQTVAIPTETVYGLAANALSEDAVKRIYEAKNRPSGNPLIVHIHSLEQIGSLAIDFPQWACDLAEKFWPGPLSIILPKSPKIPSIVTGGSNTVAVRMPNHPVALEILKQSNLPLAAPSANQSNGISPTRASHVLQSLGNKIPLIIDGGLCQGGIESTVIHQTGSGELEILRPGSITAQEIFDITGFKTVIKSSALNNNEVSISPGTYRKHYSPNTPLVLIPKEESNEIFQQLIQSGKSVGWMRLGGIIINSDTTQIVAMPDTPEGYSRKLYDTLFKLDSRKFDVIICDLPQDGPAWVGVLDRLRRAATA